MVSRRNFVSICMMMLVILFLFLFSLVIKEQENDFDVNEYAKEQSLSGEDRWVMTNSQEELAEQEYILFFGKTDSSMGKMVDSWCTYGKNQLLIEETFDLHDVQKLPEPDMILIDCTVVDVVSMLDWLQEMTISGVNLVFCNLPDSQVIEENSDLKDMLGVVSVMAPSKEVEGIRLFSGFLVGGEAIYKAKTEEEEKMQDLSLNMPWYKTGSGVATYMVGMLDEAQYERENFPPIIWKNSYNGAAVFAINGDYMSDLTGLGILSAIKFQVDPYTIYPVVNAHNTVMTNYPGFAEENAEKVQELYSRSVSALYRDIMWPGLAALSESVDLKLTFALIPQYQYADGLEPSGEELVFYLRQMKEIHAEVGLSLDYEKDVSLEEKLTRDQAFLKGLESSYKYQAYCMLNDDPETLDSTHLALMEDVATISCLTRGDNPLVSYYDDEITMQFTTGDASKYTYSDDLRFRSLESALGYSNVIVDLNRVVWPETKDEQWEIYFDDVSSNLSTYWTPYDAYDSTTLSESDARIRSFLNLDYELEETKEGMKISVSNFGEEAWFLFRTHGEDVARMTGGEFKKMEENVFLLHITSEEVTLKMKTSEEEPEFIFPGEAGN